MSNEVQEQSAGYNLADLKPVLEKASGNNSLLDSLPIWLSAQTAKSAGRGRSADNTHQYGLQKLRELILELAVRGMLVKQATNDEPASVLLEKIAEEKARLIKEGKIKKQKKLPGISDDEIPFALPKGWSWTRLNNLSPLSLNDGDWIESKDQDVNGNIRLIQLGDVGVNIFKDSSRKFINSTTFERLNCFELLEGDILVARLPSPIGRACIFPGVGQPAITAVDVAIIRPDNHCSTQYIVHAINTPNFRQQVEEFGKGATRFRISTGNLKTILVPLPPLAEQHRIVKKVDELMALCDKLEQQQADAVQAHDTLVKVLLDTLTQSDNADDFQQNWHRIAEHFDTLFITESSIEQLKQTLLQLAVMGKLVPQYSQEDLDKERLTTSVINNTCSNSRNKPSKAYVDFEGLEELKVECPDTWQHVRLGEISNVVRGGSPRPAGDPQFYDGKIPFLKVGDVTRKKGKFVESYNSTIKEAGLKKTRQINEPTVLLSNSGATLGIPAICNFSTTFNDGIAAFIDKSESVTNEYLYLYLSTLREWFLNVASRGQGQPNLNTDIIRSTWMPLPPVSEQNHIVKKIDELMALCDQLKDRLNQAQTIQQQLADATVEKTLKI